MTAMTQTQTGSRWGREIVSSFKLGWPLIFTNLSQAALTATDVILIGRLGADTLAAAVLTTSFIIR